MKYYVYQFVDPRDGKVFYVGKGSGHRIYAKRSKEENLYLYNKIQSIHRTHEDINRQKIKCFENEAEAYIFEKQLITNIGLKNLCNVLPGGNAPPSRSRANHSRHVDLIGRRFGRLKVLALGETSGKNSYWICECSCGILKEIRQSSLKTIKSCGCYKLTEEYRESLCGKGVPHTQKAKQKISETKRQQKNYNAKLTWALVNEIRKLYATEKYTQQNLADRSGVARTTINNVVNHYCWKDASRKEREDRIER